MSSLSTSLGYYPAELKTGKSGWRIVYYVENPSVKGKMVRKTVKLNRINPITERRKYAQKLKKSINNKLEKGWNPFLKETAPNGFVKMEEAFSKFINVKKRELRPDSIRTYKSYCSLLTDFVKTNSLNEFLVSFTHQDALNYMNEIYLKRKVSNNTYNNYLLGYRVIFNWLLENKYVANNPFKTIKRKKAQQKIRRILTEKEYEDLINIYSNDSKYSTIIYLAYYGLLRPNEITHLKPENCFLNDDYLRLDYTKNTKSRVVSMPKFLRDRLIRINKKTKAGQYLFGEGFVPSNKKLDPREISREWSYARKKLKWGADLQFYSLRDSGIVNMLRNGIPLEEVQKHADHASITTTEKYITLAFPKGVQSIKRLGIKGTY